MKPTHQPREVFRVSTRVLMLSVEEVKVYPGPMTGGRGRSSRGACVAMSLGLGFKGGVRVAQRRRVSRSRPGVEVHQQAVVERVSFLLHHPTLRVLDVA